jgi:DNA-binding response OmpR family regulator
VAAVLICSDAEWVHDEVRQVLSATGDQPRSVYQGAAVLPAVQKEPPGLVVLDFQVGSMGGMATCLEIRLEEAAGRLARVPVLMLLDRRADVFLARRSEAEGWVVKPLDPIRLRKAVTELLAGRTFHDASFRPVPVVVGDGGAARGDTAGAH